MKLIFSFGTILTVFGIIFAVVSVDGQESVQIDLPVLHASQPEGCDRVIEPRWFGTTTDVISNEISQATDGARICISSGTYADALLIEKPVEIIGFGKTIPVIVSTTSADGDCCINL